MTKKPCGAPLPKTSTSPGKSANLLSRSADMRLSRIILLMLEDRDCRAAGDVA